MSIPTPLRIVPAKADDASELTRLTKQSKAYWGFSKQQIDAWAEDLTITRSYINDHHVFKCIDKQDQILGYYSYFNLDQHTVMLDNLFVWPDFIGRGLGKFLMQDFIQRLEKPGIQTIKLYSEIKAEDFYKKQGFETRGYFWSHFSDRKLPIMLKNIQ